MRKYGIENFRFYFRRTFKFEGREKLNPTEKQAFNTKFKAAYLHPCEKYWIRRLDLIKNGYNMIESGRGGAGHVYTDEQKAKGERGNDGQYEHAHQTRHPLRDSSEMVRCKKSD